MRNRTTTLILAAACLAAAPAHADLRYTMRLDVRPASATRAAASPASKVLAGEILKALAPSGSSTSTFAAGDSGVRAEYSTATPRVPVGHVLLTMSDGSAVVLNPTDKTFRRFPARPARAPQAPPPLTVKRTGQFERVAGYRAERVTFSLGVPTPKLDPQTAASLPGTLTIEGELWVTDEVTVPGPLALQASPALRAFGLDRVIGNGFVLRQVMRGSVLAGNEIEMTVTDIDRGPVPAALLSIPPDYKEYVADKPQGR